MLAELCLTATMGTYMGEEHNVAHCASHSLVTFSHFLEHAPVIKSRMLIAKCLKEIWRQI